MAACMLAGVLPASSAVLLPPISGSLNSSAAPGYAVRGAGMLGDANSHGASDQLSEALRLFPTESEAERTRIAYALNAMTLPGGDAMKALDDFINDYPASAWRLNALVAVGDVWFDRGDYAIALQAYNRVNLDGLDSSSADDVLYHSAYCRLKLTDYQSAKAAYTALERSEYSNEARFYLGYISYAESDYRNAATLFESVNPDGMPCEMADYYLAQIYYATSDFPQAASKARLSLSRDLSRADSDSRAEMNRILGESLYRLGDSGEAITYLERYASEASEPQLSALYILGIDDYDHHRYEQAVKRLTLVSTDNSAMGQSAFLYIGQSYLKLDNYNAASLALDKAARMDFDYGVQEAAFYNLAVAGMQGGKVPFGSSVSLLEEFLRRYPDSAYASEVADYVVNGYISDNNYQAALEAINRVNRPSQKILEAKQKVLYTLGVRALQAGKANLAVTYLSDAAAMPGCDAATAADALLWKGEAQFKADDYKGAVQTLNAYLKQNHGSAYNRALAYYDLGYARLALKDYSDSKADFKKFIERAPSQTDKSLLSDAYNRMADAQYYMSDFSGAASTYSKAYATNPSAGDYPMFQQGIMKGLQRDHRGKIDKLNEMMTTFPQSALIPSALLEMGESYGELGESARAIETYTILAKRYPSTSKGRQGQLMLAITYLNQGNRRQAIEHYKKVITDYPSSAEARVAADDLKQLYAEQGAVAEYVAFINSVPNAPRPGAADLAALTLVSAEKALESNRLAEAWNNAVEIIEKYPDSPQVLEALAIKADVETRQGRTTDAMATYETLESRASSPSDVNVALLGMLRLSRELADNEKTISIADRIIESSTLGEAGKREVYFIKAMALSDSKKHTEALEIWTRLATDIDDIYGTKSQFYIAEYYAGSGNDAKALDAVNILIDANPPHDYWLARGFILLSDLLRRRGDTFEADEYLRSLRENYPGNEADIFSMIEQRLK